MKTFIVRDAQMKAALDLMESAGILNEIRARAIEEAVSECMLESDDVMVKAKAVQMMYSANKLRSQK